jgi:hypothetical protein
MPSSTGGPSPHRLHSMSITDPAGAQARQNRASVNERPEGMSQATSRSPAANHRCVRQIGPAPVDLAQLG